jgi:hypothetical protein
MSLCDVVDARLSASYLGERLRWERVLIGWVRAGSAVPFCVDALRGRPRPRPLWQRWVTSFWGTQFPFLHS